MQHPYYGAPGGGYPPPQQQQQPYGGNQQQPMYYNQAPPQPVYGYPPQAPGMMGGYAQPQQQPVYGGGYEDDRYRRDARGGNDRRRGRGRSRSPSQDRSRKYGGGRPEQARHAAPPIPLPSLKPGEVTFALLVPAFGVAAMTNKLMEVATANSVTITVQDESQGGSATRRSLRFIGTWDKLRPAQKQVLELLNQNAKSDAVFAEETLVIIPRDRAQNLTQSLSDIQTATSTTIEVFPSRGGADANIALVCISSRQGSNDDEKRKNESEAVTRIKAALDIKILPSELPEPSESWYKLYIPVASRFAGSVIGKNAAIVRELESDTKARITLSREGTKVETPTEVFRFVTAEGTGEQVRSAFEKVMGHINDAKERAKAELKDGNIMKVPLSVPDQLIGVIIGRQGKVLRDLQEDTGTKIHIEHSGKDDRTPATARLVEISGDPDKVEKAQMIVVERLTQAMMDQPPSSSSTSRTRARSRSPSETRPHARRGPPPPLTQDVAGGDDIDTMVIAVPIAQAGAVIGNRGETVRQICEASGARIHIEERDKLAPDATERAVTITGSTSQVGKAFNLIQTALSESADPRKPAGRDDGRRGAPQTTARRDAPYGGGGGGGYPQPPPPAQPQYMQQQPPPQYGQPAPYYQPQQQQPSAPLPYYNNYPPRSGNPVQLPSLPPPVQPQQQQQGSQFDLGILTQLAKNLPPIGSGVITQITGSPQPPPQQQQHHHQQHPGGYGGYMQ